MSEENRVEVKVGHWSPDGTFLGELVRFTGEEVGSYTDYAEARDRDDRGATYTLYRRAGSPGRYRVHVERWTRWQGEENAAYLWPQDEDGAFYAASEEEAREYHAHLFAAVGIPNIRDID